MMATGKWREPDVPQRGWICVGVEDLGSPDAYCEMCDVQEIRYVHYMVHHEYPGQLGVGCVCASNMSDDYVNPERRERQLRNQASRRRRWLTRKWRVSRKGNDFLNTDGCNIAIYQTRRGWTFRLVRDSNGASFTYKKVYGTQDEAKLAAFDAMIFQKNQ